MKRVAVVILNWNGVEYLRKFLPSVVAHSSNVADIVVADNASTDSSLAFLESEYPQISIIKNNSNGGFAKGYNDALAQLEHEYYVLLNSDIEVTANWINPIIALMGSDHRIAACQPKLRSFYNKECFEYAGAAGGFIDAFGYPFCRGRIFQEIEKDTGQYDQATEIFWASGACMFVRAKLFHRFGGFDNDFFAHMEEIDICWRLKNAGYRIMFCPDTLVYHVGGGTLPKKSSRKTYLNFRNNLTLLFKNIPSGQVLKVFATRIVLDLAAALKFLSEGGFADALAVFRAHLYFITNLRSQIKKRKRIFQWKVPGIYTNHIVLEHYLRKKLLFSDLSKEKFTG